MSENINPIFDKYKLEALAGRKEPVYISSLASKDSQKDLEALIMQIRESDRWDIIYSGSYAEMVVPHCLLFKVNGLKIGTYKPNKVDYQTFAAEYDVIVIPTTYVIPIRKGDVKG